MNSANCKLRIQLWPKGGSLLLFLLINLLGNSVSVFADLQDTMYQQACAAPSTSQSPWHISRLYDCESRSLFIPYQLWSGSSYNGDKTAQCMHEVSHTFVVSDGENVTITGPHNWNNPRSGKTEVIWLRRSNNSKKIQHFICHDKGIGRVYDSRRDRYFISGRCKFPAGFGWRLNKQVICKDTKIELTSVVWTEDDELQIIEFKWWFRRKSGQWHHDHTYRYAPGSGMTHAWKQ